MTKNCQNVSVSWKFISLIHSGYFYSASSSPLLLRGVSRHSMDTVSKFHAKAPQATASEGLAEGHYMAARAGVKPMTLWTKGVDSTNAPSTPHFNISTEC